MSFYNTSGYESPAWGEDGLSATSIPRLSDSFFMLHDPAAATLDVTTPGPTIDADNYTGVSVDDSVRDPQYYSHRYRLIGTLFQGVILAVGVAGNALVVAVVARSRSMRSPTNCYLVSLAVADSIVLIASVPNEILSYFLIGNRWVWGEPGCALFIFSQNLGINASSLSLVALTVERYVGICHPMRAQAMCTVSRAKKITMGVWAFATLYCSPWLGLTETKPLKYRGHPEVRYCDFKRPRQEYLAYFFADLVVFYVIPLLISCALYILIARVLFARRRLFRQTCSEAAAAVAAASTNGASTSTGLQAPPAATATNFKSPPLHIESTANANHARAQVVKMLAIVVAVFATLWLPYRGMLVYNSFAILFSKEKFMDLWFLMFAKTCVYINSAINPILYNALSFKFRREFQKTLMCGKRRERWSVTGWGGGRSHLPSTSTLLRHSTPKSQAVGQKSEGAAAARVDCGRKAQGRLCHEVKPQQHQPRVSPPTDTDTTVF